MTATLRVEMGPCDDNAYLYLNGRYTLQTKLDESRQIRRELPDGDYQLRLLVVNTGGWAWRAKLRAAISSTEIVNIDEDGGSGFYTGPVFDKEWQFSIRNGVATEF